MDEDPSRVHSVTVSIPFIFLKPRGRLSAQPKKAQFPASFSGLMKVCKKLFQAYGDVRSIWSVDGLLIQKLEDVIPGSTYLVSSLDPDMKPIETRPVCLQQPPKVDPVFSSDSYNRLFGTSQPCNDLSANLGLSLTNKTQQDDDSPQRKQWQGSRRSGPPGTPPKRSTLPLKNTPKSERDRNEGSGFPEAIDTRRRSQEKNTPKQDGRRTATSALRRRQGERTKGMESNEDFSEEERFISTNQQKRNTGISSSLTPTKNRMKGRSATPTNRRHHKDDEKATTPSSKLRQSRRSGTPVKRAGMSRTPTPQKVTSQRITSSDDDESEMNIQNEKVDNEVLMRVIREEIGDDSMDSKVRRAFAKSEVWVKELLAAAPTYEKQHEQVWFHKGHQLLASQSIFVSDSDIFGYAQISGYVKSVISKHRFWYPGGVDYGMHVAIIGPRQSGKSHVLTVFADEIMLEFAMNGLWKKTFFMFINFRLLGPFVNDVDMFYTHFVEEVLKSLVWQRPALEKWLPKLRSFFLAVTAPEPCPRIPINSRLYQENPHFAVSIQKILDRLWDLWNDPEALGPWLTTVFLLPSLISEAAGFTSVFYFIDNFEFADQDLWHPAPFTESKDQCFVIEFFKFAIQRGNFVLTSENQERLQELLTQIELGGTDLYHRIDVVTLTNIITESDERVVKIDIQGENAPFQLTMAHCCGIPAYVALWKELNSAIDGGSKGDAEDDEQQVLILVHAQHLLDTIFVFPESESLFVTGVRR